MRFHAIQTDPHWENPPANRADIEIALERCAPAAGDFVILPELCETGFTMNSDLAARDDSVEWWSTLARTRNIFVQCGIACRNSGGAIFNTATIFAPDGSQIGQYRKVFLFSPSGEDRSYCPGEGAVVIDCAGIRVAPMICYDLRFPELWRHALLGGAEVFTMSACWPTLRLHQKHAMLASRAIENQAWVVACNRTGDEPTAQYSGGSTIVDFSGATKAMCGSDASFISHEIDLAEARALRGKFKVISDIQRKFLGPTIFSQSH